MFNIGLLLRENKEMEGIDLDYYHKGTVLDIKIPEYPVKEHSFLNVSRKYKKLTTLRYPLTANETNCGSIRVQILLGSLRSFFCHFQEGLTSSPLQLFWSLWL